MNILEGRAMQYAEDVVEGKEITTWEVKKQCEIFINDYKNRQYKDDFNYYIDKDEVEKINNLLKLMNYPTGFLAGKQVLEHIAPFQAFFLYNIFGWRFKDRQYKFRYNGNTLYIARKNSKTWLIATVYIIGMLTEQNMSEFYSISLTKELAAEVKKIMGQIINASPLLKKHFIVSTTKTGKIFCKVTQCFYEPRVNEAGKNNSVRPAYILADEFGNFTENSNFTAMQSGMRNVKNAVVFRTTTAYAINNSIMEDEIDYIRKVLKGVVADERMFALLYYADKENLWNDTGIYQANPLRIEENYETMREDRTKAQIQSNLVEEYLTKTMNVFVQENKDEAYMDIELWKKCQVDKVDFEGKDVVVAVDGSISLDLTSISIMYKEDGKYYCMSHGFLPGMNMGDRREKIDYYSMERQGHCDIHDAYTVQYNLLEEYIRGIEDKYNCRIITIVSDPFNMKQTMENLAEDYDVVMLKQTYTNLSPATKAFRDEVYNGNVFYQKNELLDWNVSNATTNTGKSGDIMLAKDKATKNKKRIDMLATLIFCMTELYLEEDTDINDYITDDYLDNLGW